MRGGVIGKLHFAFITFICWPGMKPWIYLLDIGLRNYTYIRTNGFVFINEILFIYITLGTGIGEIKVMRLTISSIYIRIYHNFPEDDQKMAIELKQFRKFRNIFGLHFCFVMLRFHFEVTRVTLFLIFSNKV